MLQPVICFSAWLKDTVDPMLVTLDHRIAALTGLDVQPPYAEYLQVVNYGIGGHYEPHFDHATVTTGSVTISWGGEPKCHLFLWGSALTGLPWKTKWRFLFQEDLKALVSGWFLVTHFIISTIHLSIVC